MANEGKEKNASTKYITYAEYKQLSLSPVDPATFAILGPRAEWKLEYFTNGRIKDLTVIPDEVKALLAIFVDTINSNINADGTMDVQGLSSYSNGIESFGYQGTGAGGKEKAMDEYLINKMKEYLFAYPELFYRGNLPLGR